MNIYWRPIIFQAHLLKIEGEEEFMNQAHPLSPGLLFTP